MIDSLIYNLALGVYDALLFFPQEVRCIWNRRCGTVTILYLFIRYSTVLDMLWQVFSSFYKPTTATVSVVILIFLLLIGSEII